MSDIETDTHLQELDSYTPEDQRLRAENKTLRRLLQAFAITHPCRCGNTAHCIRCAASELLEGK